MKDAGKYDSYSDGGLPNGPYQEPVKGASAGNALPEFWQCFQLNRGWNTWENVMPSSHGEPGVVGAYTADQMRAYGEQCARAALASQSTPVAPVVGQARDERETFERYITGTLKIPADRDADGAYQWFDARTAWYVWQARASQSAPSPVEDKDGEKWKARYEARELEAHQLSEKLIQLRRVGEVLSNCAFNLSLRDPGQFTTRDIEVLASAFKAWDAAVSKIWSNGVDRALAQEGAKK